ncbi:hypothetical protein [Clostridium sp. 'White wine YQ']|uniref:hypothetical protein n=1 Tax=Clostridium sp. 'White wine YQ' TaxID=3027474 RepID=UPI0023667D3E|nr:hypothetical protein [Clostridium sp. 'White wine YQ']MDD7794797.1 hypothetical protein [Clostridium sp. 'White wine YQ']
MRKKVKRIAKQRKQNNKNSHSTFNNYNRNRLANSNSFYRTKRPSSKEVFATVATVLGIAVIIVGIIVFVSTKLTKSNPDTISIFSGKTYLASLNINSSSKYKDVLYETDNLHSFDGIVLGESEYNGEKRFRFCVDKNGITSYDTEITDAQGQLFESPTYKGVGKVEVYKRTYTNSNGEAKDTFYYKIYCDQSEVKQVSLDS